MKFTYSTLSGVITAEPRCFRDERGFFMEKHPQTERTIVWNDASPAIPCPLINGQPPLLSSIGAKWMPLKDAEVFA
jgi:dTDP-4-dehydrorhamnose 3,5-epimerase-like enzyme